MIDYTTGQFAFGSKFGHAHPGLSLSLSLSLCLSLALALSLSLSHTSTRIQKNARHTRMCTHKHARTRAHTHTHTHTLLAIPEFLALVLAAELSITANMVMSDESEAHPSEREAGFNLA